MHHGQVADIPSTSASLPLPIRPFRSSTQAQPVPPTTFTIRQSSTTCRRSSLPAPRRPLREPPPSTPNLPAQPSTSAITSVPFRHHPTATTTRPHPTPATSNPAATPTPISPAAPHDPPVPDRTHRFAVPVLTASRPGKPAGRLIHHPSSSSLEAAWPDLTEAVVAKGHHRKRSHPARPPRLDTRPAIPHDDAKQSPHALPRPLNHHPAQPLHHRTPPPRPLHHHAPVQAAPPPHAPPRPLHALSRRPARDVDTLHVPDPSFSDRPDLPFERLDPPRAGGHSTAFLRRPPIARTLASAIPEAKRFTDESCRYTYVVHNRPRSDRGTPPRRTGRATGRRRPILPPDIASSMPPHCSAFPSLNRKEANPPQAPARQRQDPEPARNQAGKQKRDNSPIGNRADPDPETAAKPGNGSSPGAQNQRMREAKVRRRHETGDAGGSAHRSGSSHTDQSKNRITCDRGRAITQARNPRRPRP